MNGKLAEIITKAGLAGISLVLALIVWNIVTNHISHNTEVLTQVVEASKAQVAATGDLVKSIDRLNFLISNDTSNK